MIKVSLTATLDQAADGVSSAKRNWRKDQKQALRDVRYAYAMLTRAEQALTGELDSELSRKTGPQT